MALPPFHPPSRQCNAVQVHHCLQFQREKPVLWRQDAGRLSYVWARLKKSYSFGCLNIRDSSAEPHSNYAWSLFPSFRQCCSHKNFRDMSNRLNTWRLCFYQHFPSRGFPSCLHTSPITGPSRGRQGRPTGEEGGVSDRTEPQLNFKFTEGVMLRMN